MAASREQTRLTLVGDDKTGRAFASADDSAARLTKGLDRVGKKAALIGTAVAAAAAVAVVALARIADDAITTADNIAKTADAIGFGTGALQEYRFAANRAGVSTAQFDSAAGALVKRVGELKNETGALRTFLDKNNIALKAQLQGTKSAEEAMRLLLKAMADTSDQSERVALSAAAFGRSAGIAMANLVKDGADSVEELRQRARDLGLVLEDDLLRGAERARDRLDELAAVIRTNLTRAVVRNADAIADATAALIGWTVAALKAVNFLDESTTEKIEALNAEIAAQTVLLEDAQAAWERVAAKAGEFPAESLRARVSFLSEKIAGLNDELAALEERAAGGAAAGDGVVPEEDTTAARLALRGEFNAEFLALDQQLAEEQRALRRQDREDFFAWQQEKFELYDATSSEIEARQRKQTGITIAFLDDEIRAQEESARGRQQAAGNFMTNLISLMGSGNKTMFEIAKAAKIADTVINTADAAMGAYSALASIPYIGPALGAAAAAAAIAAGIMQIARIRATKFGGGGSVGGSTPRSPSVSPAAPPRVADVTALPPSVQPLAPKQINITIVGETISSQQVRDLIGMINDEQADGTLINVTAA